MQKAISTKYKTYICSTNLAIMFDSLLPILLIIAVSVLLLSIRLFLGKPFVSTHVHDNKALRRKGISCAKEQARNAFKDGPHRVTEKRSTN